jgi:hypothetical protein
MRWAHGGGRTCFLLVLVVLVVLVRLRARFARRLLLLCDVMKLFRGSNSKHILFI